ncbi:MAG: hypothetical protein JO097_00515 [Acidobacteriaceae bacterium]|nr:hypothetical protein [Acidobacteriaceae bacterium]
MVDDWLNKGWFANCRWPHPESPAGSNFDWQSIGVPHPDSPAGQFFEWSSIGLPHPYSPAGKNYLYAGITAGAPSKTQTDPEIEALHLSAVAKKAAYELKKKHPSVHFTSGRRNKQEQAHAMAANVVLNRNWIKETYVQSAARDACQKWVDENKQEKTTDKIAAGLKNVLDGLTDTELARLSKHLSGDAFDVQPVEKDAAEIKKTIRGLPGLDKFLEKEGGLVRWHAQF